MDLSQLDLLLFQINLHACGRGVDLAHCCLNLGLLSHLWCSVAYSVSVCVGQLSQVYICMLVDLCVRVKLLVVHVLWDFCNGSVELEILLNDNIDVAAQL